MARIKDWPTNFFGDISLYKRKCSVCGGTVKAETGLFWYEKETISFYHEKCAKALVSGLAVDLVMLKATKGWRQ